ncbi:MAG TPA: hypothetical protein VMW16_06315 [Sedimentisphaerales bacterium]|nr:hypothetical protein [Sedimentisphaerales bacterium]
MRHRLTILCLVVLCMYSKILPAETEHSTSNLPQLPPIETFLLEPIELEKVSVWVPAAKAGPVINRACQARGNSLYLAGLPVSVNHTKTESCPDEVGRLLAEYTASFHQQDLPLTIFNGWQWEYTYGLSELAPVRYDLPARGGSWENSWEAILTQGVGSVSFQWTRLSASGDSAGHSDGSKEKSNIELRTFSFMRTRDGYPKTRKL